MATRAHAALALPQSQVLAPAATSFSSNSSNNARPVIVHPPVLEFIKERAASVPMPAQTSMGIQQHQQQQQQQPQAQQLAPPPLLSR
mmetsp:Transcript_1015/g.1924  ORF Transcript_1015/g.1924 Transcript_1015/m.1924 type:complete len:87 (-) Transcript_1015:92-352(-)